MTARTGGDRLRVARPARTLYLRVFLPFFLVLIIATTLAWWVATSMMSASLGDRLDKQLGHAATVLAAGGFPFTEELLQRLGRLLRAEIILVRADGSLGPSTTADDRGALAQAVLDKTQQWRDAGISHHDLAYQGTPYRLIIHNLAETGRDPRYAAIAALASLEEVGHAARRAGLWLGGAVLLGTIVVAWLGHHIARGVTVPVTQLASMASRIADGDRAVRFETARTDEVGRLADALNAMAARLAEFEREIAEQSRLAALGNLAARVAHEVRNPLTAIKLQVQLLGESLDPEGRGKVASLLDEIGRLELIVSRTLAMGRAPELVPVAHDLNQLVAEVTALMTPQLSHQGIAVEQRLDPLPTTLLDGDAVKQVLLNLLTNAADELSHGGRILVRTGVDAAQQRVILAVEDSGAGVSAEDQQALFSPLASNKDSGFGLGLALSRELVALHGGAIDAQRSDALGGACFTVRLPIRETHVAEVEDTIANANTS